MRRRGRTLLELVVVLAILGLVARLVAPAVLSEPRPRAAQGTARALVARLDEAHALAATRGAAVTLVLDPRTGRLWVADPDRDDALPVAAGEIPLPATVAVDADAPRAVFTFEPDGRAEGGAVRIRDGRDAILVTVDRWTGEARSDAR